MFPEKGISEEYANVNTVGFWSSKELLKYIIMKIRHHRLRVADRVRVEWNYGFKWIC